jgi:hypothetical protein
MINLLNTYGQGPRHNTPLKAWDGTYTQSGKTVNLNYSDGDKSVADISKWTKVNGLNANAYPANVQRATAAAPVTLPAELIGTWVRKGADSGRAFDTTQILTANKMELKYSDGRSVTATVKSVKAANNPIAAKAGEYPSGWIITYSVTAVEGNAPVNVGGNWVLPFYLNAAKKAYVQKNDDLKDIWVKQ